MRYEIVTENVSEEMPHSPGIFTPGDRIHSADTGLDVLEGAKLPGDRLLEELGRYPHPADALRKELFETRSAVKGGEVTVADIERKMAATPVGSDPADYRTHEHYLRRARADLVQNKQRLDGLIESLRGYGEEHTVD